MTAMTTPAAPALTLADVTTFILTTATQDDIDRIHTAAKARTRSLREVLAAQVQVGASTTLQGLSPKYLNGMRGTVASIKGARGDVLLDEESTRNLRYLGARRYYIPAETTQYTLTGVPLSCIGPAA